MENCVKPVQIQEKSNVKESQLDSNILTTAEKSTIIKNKVEQIRDFFFSPLKPQGEIKSNFAEQ